MDSALRRARAHLAQAGPAEQDLAELPPIPTWFTGREAVTGFPAELTT